MTTLEFPSSKVAALFVEYDGVYFNRSDVILRATPSGTTRTRPRESSRTRDLMTVPGPSSPTHRVFDGVLSLSLCIIEKTERLVLMTDALRLL